MRVILPELSNDILTLKIVFFTILPVVRNSVILYCHTVCMQRLLRTWRRGNNVQWQ
jgi:hypothetical protein